MILKAALVRAHALGARQSNSRGHAQLDAHPRRCPSIASDRDFFFPQHCVFSGHFNNGCMSVRVCLLLALRVLRPPACLARGAR
jgi:hypothetical protein